jgi:hypothetical protein
MTGAIIFLVVYFIVFLGTGYMVIKTKPTNTRSKQLPSRKEWYVQCKDHQKKDNIYVVQLKRGAHYMYPQEIDLRADDYEDQLHAAISRAEDRANTLNAQQRLLNKYGPAVIDSMAYSPTTGDKKASVILIIRRVSTCAECGEAIKYGNYVCKECKDA